MFFTSSSVVCRVTRVARAVPWVIMPIARVFRAKNLPRVRGGSSPVHERSIYVFARTIFRVSKSIARIVDGIVVHGVVARSTTADRGRPCERGDFIARDAPRAGGRELSRDRRRGVDAILSIGSFERCPGGTRS
jgi:hypothetical protein